VRAFRRLIACALALVSTGAACDDGGSGDEAPPTFQELRAEVLTPACVFQACHKSGASPAGMLNLEGEDDAVHMRIVDAPATVTGRVLVVPMDPDASYLFEKLVSDMPAVGTQMPMTGPLEDYRIEMVRAWIEAGAAND